MFSALNVGQQMYLSHLWCVFETGDILATMSVHLKVLLEMVGSALVIYPENRVATQ